MATEKRVIHKNRGFVIRDGTGYYWQHGGIFSNDLQDAAFIREVPACFKLNVGMELVPAKKLRGEIKLLKQEKS